MDAVAPRPGFQPAITVAVGASPVQKQSSGLQPSRPQALTPSAPMPGLFPSERASTDIYRCIQPAGPLGAGWPLVGAHLCEVRSGYRGWVRSSQPPTRQPGLARYFLHAVFLFSTPLSFFSLVFITYHSRRFDRTNLPTCRSAQRAAPCFRASDNHIPPNDRLRFYRSSRFPAVKTKTGPTLLLLLLSSTRPVLSYNRHHDNYREQFRLSLFVTCPSLSSIILSPVVNGRLTLALRRVPDR